jgi:hypothetical protein
MVELASTSIQERIPESFLAFPWHGAYHAFIEADTGVRPAGTGKAVSAGTGQGTGRLGQFLERIPSGVSIAAWPVRLMDESSATVKAEQIQKDSH